MKNLSIIFILLSFCIVFFSGCKKEDELSTREKIIGKWTNQSLQTVVYNEADVIIEDYTRNYSEIIEYKSNNIFESIDSTNASQVWKQTGTWELINDTIISMTYKVPGIGGINEDSLTANFIRTIEEITSNRLVCYRRGEAISNATGEKIKIKNTYTYVK